MCQCSSELHFISTVNLVSIKANDFLCQCSSEIHFISTGSSIFIDEHHELCQCSSELHFISTNIGKPKSNLLIAVSMLFRASLHFYEKLERMIVAQELSVNALPSFTSFLRDEKKAITLTDYCVNALPSFTSFLLCFISPSG